MDNMEISLKYLEILAPLIVSKCNSDKEIGDDAKKQVELVAIYHWHIINRIKNDAEKGYLPIEEAANGHTHIRKPT